MRRFALIGVLAVMLTAPVLAVGYSDGHGRGGSFGDYDPIIEKYNASGELFVIRGRCQVGLHPVPEHPQRLHCGQCPLRLSRRPVCELHAAHA